MLPLTRHGWREMLFGTMILAAVALALGVLWRPLALLPLPLLVWLFAFFRDPQRPIPADEGLMVSPADGTVSDITQVTHDPLLGGPAVRVGIFLSVFNVHINRSPCRGRVISITYQKGKFINALHHNQASTQNESNTLVLGEAGVDGNGGADDGSAARPIAVVKQIVGLIARRIICTARIGDTLDRGQRIGMIKFGSRTELYIPLWLDPQIRVKIGQKVRGGYDVLAAVRQPSPLRSS